MQMPEGDCCSGPTMPGSWPRSHNSHCRSHRPVPSAPVRSVGAAFIVQPDFFAALVSREDGGRHHSRFPFLRRRPGRSRKAARGAKRAFNSSRSQLFLFGASTWELHSRPVPCYALDGAPFIVQLDFPVLWAPLLSCAGASWQRPHWSERRYV